MKANHPQITLAFESDCYLALGAELERQIAQGKRTLLITSSGPGEGKSTIAAGLARVLSRLRGNRVVLVDTDQYRPSQHDLFGVDNARGLGELLDEVYRTEPGKKDRDGLEFGDWIELLQVQGRSGRLTVSENEHAYVVALEKGTIVGVVEAKGSEDRLLADALESRGLLTPRQREVAARVSEGNHEPFGDVVLRLGYIERGPLLAVRRMQASEHLHSILAMRHPGCEFAERSATAAAPGQPAPTRSYDGGIDAHLAPQLREFTRRPYLARRIEGFLKGTDVPNLKVLTSGGPPSDLMTPSGSAPLKRLLDNLSRMFDVVIVDSPPVAVTSPAEAIAEMVDGVLLVVKANGYEVQVVRRAKERLESRGVRLIGVVLNQVDFQYADDKLHYYYSYTHPAAAAGDPRPRAATGGSSPR